METVNSLLLLGITQGISSWIYYYIFPTNFFFTVLFCHKNCGMVLAYIVSKLLGVKHKYLDDMLLPLIPGIISYQFMRFEVYTREHYLLTTVANMHGMEMLFYYIIPFYTFWAISNWCRKNVGRMSYFFTHKEKS